jgi:hypothetical protein
MRAEGLGGQQFGGCQKNSLKWWAVDRFDRKRFKEAVFVNNSVEFVGFSVRDL